MCTNAGENDQGAIWKLRRDSELYQTYLQILKEELVPAMGCTEPIAIAYCTARAAELLKEYYPEIHPDGIEIYVSNNIIKNVKSVVVPNTGGMRGIEAAAAAGLVSGRADRKLEVLASLTEEDHARIRELTDRFPMKITALGDQTIFDIMIVLSGDGHEARVRISDSHTNIVLEQVDRLVLLNTTASGKECVGSEAREDTDRGKSSLTVERILDFATTCDIRDVKEILDRQISYNMAIAEEGLLGDYGANVGSTYLKNYGYGVRNRAIAKAAAGSDARMSGCELPVVINSGSGNQGITVSIPVIEYAKELSVPKEKLYRALVLSNLIAIHEKAGIGTLSAYCGAVSAGCAAGCGIAYLCGGDLSAIDHTLVNSVVIVSGIICDGAKASCAAKIAQSVSAGILGYDMYLNGQEFKSGDGIVNRTVESTIDNVSRLGREGMRETDREIVKIMMHAL